MKRSLLAFIACIFLVGCSQAYAASATQTFNTIPAQDSSFFSNATTFFGNEDANRYSGMFSGFVYAGGIGATAAGLSHTPSSLTAIASDGFYVSQPGVALTYTDARRTYVYLDSRNTRSPEVSFTNGNGCTFSARNTRIVRAECTTGSGEPTPSVTLVPLMAVTTAGGAITGVVDLRAMEPHSFGVNKYGTLAAALAATDRVVINRNMILHEQVSLDSDDHLTIEPGRTIYSGTKTWIGGMILIQDASNVLIDGSGLIDGDKANNPTGRIFGIEIHDSDRVTIRGIAVNNMPGSNAAGTFQGDGIYIGGDAGGDGSNNVLIDGVTLDGNVRQGISIVRATYVRVSNSYIVNTTGTFPGCGIDIEPDSDVDTVRHISIVGNTFENNECHITMSGGDSAENWDVSIVGNTMRNHRNSSVSTLGAIRLTRRGVSVVGNTIYYGVDGTDDATGGIVCHHCRDSVISGNVIISTSTDNSDYGIYLYNSSGGVYNVSVTGNSINGTGGQGINLYQDDSATAGDFRDIVISGNTLYNTQDENAGNSEGDIHIEDGNAGVTPGFARIVIIGNTTRCDSTCGQFGIRTSNVTAANFGTFIVEGNTSSGSTTSNYLIQGTRPLTIGRIEASATLDFNLAAVTFQALTITVTGAAAGDSVCGLSVPTAAQGTFTQSYTAVVSATDTVTVVAHAADGQTPNPGSGTFKVIVCKH